jgi:hypothetical protein
VVVHVDHSVVVIVERHVLQNVVVIIVNKHVPKHALVIALSNAETIVENLAIISACRVQDVAIHVMLNALVHAKMNVVKIVKAIAQHLR